MPLRAFSGATEAFHSIAHSLARDGQRVPPIRDHTSVGSAFGTQERSTIEVVAEGFTLSDPRARWVLSPARRMDPSFAIANAIWALSGSDDLEAIAFYNPRGRSFSTDAKTVSGAIGARLFFSAVGDQIASVIRRLQADPTSRRTAVLSLTAEDVILPPAGTPCSIAFQYLLRDGALSAITYMRSQSAVGVLPYDLHLFTMLQESIAVTLGAKLGAYHHFCGSLHYYDDEAQAVDRVIGSKPGPDVPMRPMTSAMMGKNNAVAQAEAELRSRLGGNPAAKIDFAALGLDHYWTQLLRLLTIGVRRSRGVAPGTDEIAALESPLSLLLP